MTEQLKIYDAVRTAMLRKVHRLAAMRDELDALGYLPFIQPHELYLLESEGFLLDFDSGLVTDTVEPQGVVVEGVVVTAAAPERAS